MRAPIQAHPVSRCSPTAPRRGVTPSFCVTATVQDGKACVNIPILGQECISVPSFVPDGATASLCAKVCTHFLKPIGVCLTASVNGNQVGQHCFGHCSN